MRVFQVRQGGTGAILWTGEALSEHQAVDAMAHEAGYADQAALPEGVRGRGLSAEELRLGATPARTAGARVTGGRSGALSPRGAAEHGGRAAG